MLQPKNLDIFPKEAVQSFIKEQPLPDDLKPQLFFDQPMTWDNLLTYCSSIANFLQNNKIHNTYALRSPCFADTFAEFNKIYDMPSTDTETVNKKLKLLNIERYIHLMIEIRTTQELSPYLQLIQELCFNDRLDDIISLVYWKFDAWVDGYGELFVNFLNFVAPYMEYLSNIKFEFTKILEKAPLDEIFVQKCLENLKNSLQSKGIKDEFQLERIGEHEYGLEFVEKAKNALLEKSPARDTQFYYDLGLCSVIYQLYKAAKENSSTLLNICLAATMHKGKIQNLGGINAGKSLKKTVQEIEAAGNIMTYWSDLLDELCFNLSQPSGNETDKGKLIPVWVNLFGLISQQVPKESTLVVISKKSSRLLLFDVLDVVENSKDHLLECKSSDGYQYSILVPFEIISRLFGSQPAIKEPETQILLYEKIQSVRKIKGLDLVTKDRCFSILQGIAGLHKEIGNKVIANWNFSETSLIDILSAKETETQEENDLMINLKYTFRYIADRVLKEPLQETEIHSLTSLSKAFIAKSLETSDKVSENQVTKLVGIFLLKIVNLDIKELSDIRRDFLPVFISFLNEKCTLDKWEIFSLQQDLWGAVQKQARTELNLSDKSIDQLVNSFEKEIGRAQITAKTFLFKDQNSNEDKTKYQIYNVIMSIIDDIAEKMPVISQKINWSRVGSPEESKTISELLMQTRRFTYFALPWLDYFIKTVNTSNKEEATQKLPEIYNKTCHLYFDPTFVLLVEKRERDLFKQFFEKAVQINNHNAWYYQSSVFDALHRAWLMIKDEEKDDGISTITAGDLKDEFGIYNLEQRASSSGKFLSATTIKLLSFMLSLSRLPQISSYSEPILSSQDENEKLIKIIKKAISSLQGYILCVQSIFGIEKTGIQPDFQQGILQIFSSSVEKSFTLAIKAPPVYNILSEFLFKLFDDSISDTTLTTWNIDIASMLLTKATTLSQKKDIVNRLIFNNKILTTLLHKCTISTKAKLSGNTSENLSTEEHDCILQFLNKLNADTHGVLNSQSAEYLRDSPNTKGKEDHKLLADWFHIFMQELEQFPYLEMLTLSNRTLIDSFKGFLMIAEKFFICTRKGFDHAISSVTKDINELEAMLNVRHPVFGLIDEGFKFSPKDREAIESKDLSDVVLEKKRRLMALNSDNEALNERMFQKLSLYHLEYTFWKLESYDKPRMQKAIQEKSKILMNEINGFNCKVIQEQSDRATAFNHVLENLFKQEAYLELIQRLETKYGNSISASLDFLNNLYNSSCMLLEQILKEESQEIENYNNRTKVKENCETKVQKVIKLFAKLYLTFCEQAHCQNNTYKNLSIFSISNWLKLIFKLHAHFQQAGQFTLVDPQKDTFPYFMSLAQFAVISEPEFVSIFLHEKPSLLSIILSQESKQAWAPQTNNQLIYVLDMILKGHLPSKTIIEAELNRIALNSDSLTVSTFVKDTLLDQGILKMNGKAVAETLFEKFSVTPPVQNGNPDNNAKVPDYIVSFDPSREHTTPQDKVQHIVNEVSSNTRSIIDTLLAFIVDNYLYNISYLANRKDQDSTTEIKIKQTSNMMIILSTLLNAHKELIAYLLFNKNDFHSQILKYQQNVYFLQEADLENFKSITLLDCLWKIKYFTLSIVDATILIKMIGVYTGVIFKSPNEPQRILDISHLSNNWLLGHMTQILKAPSVDPLTLSNFSALLGVMWWNVTHNLCLMRFDKDNKGGILSLLKQILYRIKDYAINSYKTAGSYQSIDNYLSLQLKAYYERQVDNCKLKVEDVHKMKKENYKSFLEDPDNLKHEISIHNDLVGMFEKIRSAIEKSDGSSVSEYDISEEEKAFLADKANSSFRRKQLQNYKIFFMLDNGCHITCGTGWSLFISNRESALKELCPLYKNEGNKEEEWHLLKELGSCQSQLKTCIPKTNFIYTSIGATFTLKFEVPAAKEDTNPVAPTPSNNKAIFDGILEVELKKSQNPAIEEEKKEHPIAPTEPTQNIISSSPAEQNTAVAAIPPKTNEIEIKYFYHSTIQNYNEFQALQNKALINLKRLNERVLVALRHHQIANNNQSIIKDIVAQEIAEELKKSSKFENNMMLCMLQDFKDFESYEYPNDYAEIKQELSWVRSNFSTYITKLGTRTDLPPPPENRDFQEFELCNTLDNRFQFSYESVSTANQNQSQAAQSIAMTSSHSERLKGPYLIDDETVESMISVFYIQYKTGMIKEVENMVNLLLELSNSALFELKLIDFCLFFLYSFDHLRNDVMDPNAFPYNKIFNADSSLDLLSIYNIVAANILGFLKFYISKRSYLIYQPRLLLEQHGLQSIRNLKKDLGYQIKTFENVSICDMLIGLSEVKEISSNTSLASELTAIVDQVLKSKNEFELLNFKESDELADKLNILTIQSCNRLVKLKTLAIVMNWMPNLLLIVPKIATKCLEAQIEDLHSTVEKVNVNLKAKLRDDPGSITLEDFQDVLSKNYQLIEFEKVLDEISSILSAWILEQSDKNKKDKKEDNNTKYLEAINWFSEKVINEKTVQDFILHLLELATYLLQPQLMTISESGSLTETLVRICTHFYALICVRSASHQLKSEPESTDSLPTLSQIISSEGADLIPIPELLSTFSYIRKERTFDFDVLYSDLCRKYKDSLSKIIKDYEGKPKKEIILICKKIPYILDFTTKCSILRGFIEDDRMALDAEGLRSINIDRKNLLSTTLLEFRSISLKEIKRPLQIEYFGEEGYDGGGLRREFFSLIAKELFDPKTGLFQVSQNGVSVQPSLHAKIVPNRLHYLRLAGIMVAKAIQDECQLDVTFTKSLLKQILGKKIAMGDLEDMDPEFTKSLKWMLENPVDELEQTFTYEENIFGEIVIKELIENGSEVLVTDKNKKDYFKKICEFKLKDEIQEELSAFIEGFHMVLPLTFFDLFGVADLQLLISGVPTIDLEEMRNHIEYSGWEEDSDTIKWFWEILGEFSQKELGAFVFFLSGSSRVGPGTNFKDIPMICANTGLESPSLPLAHTCYREIEIPLYSSKEEFRQKLLMAIYEGQVGFEFR